MLITCFQCRQQLEVPEASAGKRVRCPHCTYVIVVPVKLTEDERAIETTGAAMALPSMDLDDGVTPPAPKPKAAAQPIPPAPLPPVVKVEPLKPEPLEELPAPPPIERGRRRRVLAPPQQSTSVAGKVLAGLGVVAALVIGVIIGAAIMNERRPRPFNGFAFPPQPPMEMKAPFMGRPQGQPFFQPQAQLNWQDFRSQEHLFKAQFPNTPSPRQMVLHQAPMSGFEARNGEWHCTVLHRLLTEKEYQQFTPIERFQALDRDLSNQLNLRREWEQSRLLSGSHPMHEWDYVAPDGHRLFAQAVVVRDDKRYRLYLLMAQGPVQDLAFNHQNNAQRLTRHHFNVTKFLTSFVVLQGIADSHASVGKAIYEVIDDTSNGARRENEFLCMAVHPNKPIAVAGAIDGHVAIANINNHQVGQAPLKPVEQVAISPDGRFLAACNGDTVRVWSHWDQQGVGAPFTQLPGRRCAITKENRVLVSSKNVVKAYDLNENNRVDAVLDVLNTTVRGLALSADEKTLATHDDKTLTIWDWPGKRLAGQFDAHDAAITAIAFAPDGKTLASASADRTIKLWDVETRTERATLKEHAWTVATLAFAPNGKYLVSGGLDGMVLVWDVQPDQPALVWAAAHRFPVRSVAFSADGQQLLMTCRQALVSAGREGDQYRRQMRQIEWNDVKLSTARAQRVVAQHAGLHLPTCAGTVLVSRDSDVIVTTSDRQFRDNFANPAPMPIAPGVTVRVWDGATGRQKQMLQAMFGCTLSPDGKWLAYSPPGQNTSVHVYDVQSWAQSNQVLQGNMGYPLMAFFTADSKSLWLPTQNEIIRFEMPKPQQAIGRFPGKVPSVVEKQRLTIKNQDNQGYMRVTPSLDHAHFVVSVGGYGAGLPKRTYFSAADGQQVAPPKPAGDERTAFLRIRFADYDTGVVELEDTVRGITHVIGRQAASFGHAAVHPQGKIAAVAGSERDQLMKMTLWDLDKRRPILSVPEADARNALALRFSPDGKHVSWVTNAGWTRIVPTDWLLERKDLLAPNPNEVAAP